MNTTRRGVNKLELRRDVAGSLLPIVLGADVHVVVTKLCGIPLNIQYYVAWILEETGSTNQASKDFVIRKHGISQTLHNSRTVPYFAENYEYARERGFEMVGEFV